ncbi:MAG: thioredoxin-dependent thiol peroxidase [Candidatus Thorarchaeota archaeon]|nr:MAG: thioredoxin-dependent thiol peroxidase [Candidatus Thorarchaeota archaeon]
MLSIGDNAPDFQTTTDTGESFKLSEKRGKRVVVYFYPADETPGCTAEACSIRDSYNTFLEKGIDVYGVSGGSRESHQRFKENHRLNFTLLIDEDHAIAKLYGVYRPVKILGKELLGVQRVTFLIDAEGKIEGIFGGPEGLDRVKTREHADQILNFWGLKL